MSVMKDGRPLFTKQTTEAAQLAALLTAPPQFLDAYKKQDPEGAYAAAASIVRAREKGKIPAEGPLADQVPPEELTAGELPNDSAGNVGKPGTGTEMDQRLPMFTRRPTDLTT
jgi:predicted GNAT family acetyltransferase